MTCAQSFDRAASAFARHMSARSYHVLALLRKDPHHLATALGLAPTASAFERHLGVRSFHALAVVQEDPRALALSSALARACGDVDARENVSAFEERAEPGAAVPALLADAPLLAYAWLDGVAAARGDRERTPESWRAWLGATLEDCDRTAGVWMQVTFSLFHDAVSDRLRRAPRHARRWMLDEAVAHHYCPTRWLHLMWEVDDEGPVCLHGFNAQAGRCPAGCRTFETAPRS